VNCHPEFDAEGVAQIIATYLQGLFRTALLSYDRSQLERQVDLFLTTSASRVKLQI
jgi:TetR/AcrR family transcriptional regulator, transcriptional repressor for nem operon